MSGKVLDCSRRRWTVLEASCSHWAREPGAGRILRGAVCRPAGH